MKANIFLSCISVLLALLLAYWTFSIAKGQENDIVCGVCSGVCFVATLLPMLAIRYDSGRQTTNLRILSMLFFVVFLISHFCFASLGIRMPYYVIVNGLVLLIFIALLYTISKNNET